MRAGIVVLRNRATVTLESRAGIVVIPSLPGTWRVEAQGATGWVYLENPDGVPFWWHTVLDGPPLGYPAKVVGIVFSLDEVGTRILKAFATANDKAWTLPELRADNDAQAMAIKAAWTMIDDVGQARMQRTIGGFYFGLDAENFATVAAMPDAD